MSNLLPTTKVDEIKSQIENVCIECNLDQDEIIKAIENAIASAYRREFGEKDFGYEAEFDLDTGMYSVFQVTNIVDEVKNPFREISVVEARLSNPNAKVGDVIKVDLNVNSEVSFGRIASQVAKQVLKQAILNAKHSKVLQQFKDKIGDLVSVEIDSYKKGGYIIKLSSTLGYISKENILPIDRFRPGQVVKALILDINEDERGNTRILLSRSHPDFIRAIITNEVPEVASKVVNIEKIVREPGSRSKVLVSVNEEEYSVDPVGTILGRKNVRLVNIMREISSTMQEKIDIIEYNPEEVENMIMDALEPARIERVEFDEDSNTADVYCYPEEAPLAVGKRGVNARLAGELLEVVINIKTIDEDAPIAISAN
jgi:N utilization substance protein A